MYSRGSIYNKYNSNPYRHSLLSQVICILSVCYIVNLGIRIRFFHMQSSKIYQLAVHPSQLPLAKAIALTDSSLPTGNIFTDGRRKWHGRKNLDSYKTYDIVGLKELKSYQNRLKKASRATLRTDSLST